MRRWKNAVLWSAAALLLLVGLAVAGAQVVSGDRGSGVPEERVIRVVPQETLRVYEGVSVRGNLQEALDDAIQRALQALPGADRMVRYRVREITGEHGGIAPRNMVRVVIETPAESAISGRNLPEEGPGASEERLRDALRVNLQLPQARVERGRSAAFVLTVRNTSREPIRIPLSSGQKYDFEVWRDNRLVWRWSEGRVFTLALTSITLKPGESVTYRETWDLRNNAGAVVPPGTYQVRGFLVPAVRNLKLGDSETLTVTGR